MFMPRRKTDLHILLIIALLATIADLVSAEHSLAQTTAYTVSELSGADRVPRRLNNLGDVAGRARDSLSGETRATTWNHGSLRRRNLGKLGGGDHSSASGINDAGEVAGAANIAKSVVP